MAQVGTGREPTAGGADLDARALEQELEALEGSLTAAPMRWPWLLVVLGLLAVVGLALHGYTAYAAVARIDANSRIETPNPLALFQEVATNGPKVGSTVESSSRATYARSLEQFVLDGTGVGLGIVLVIAGAFILLNR
jgi:hypothetical protein